jgi:glucokinase
MTKFCIGIDLGGTRIKSGLLKGNVVLEKKILDAESGKGLQPNLARLETVIDELLKKYEVKAACCRESGLPFRELSTAFQKDHFHQ